MENNVFYFYYYFFTYNITINFKYCVIDNIKTEFGKKKYHILNF